MKKLLRYSCATRQAFPKVLVFSVFMIGLLLTVSTTRAQVINEGFEDAGWITGTNNNTTATVGGNTTNTWYRKTITIVSSTTTNNTIHSGSKGATVQSSGSYIITPVIAGGVTQVTAWVLATSNSTALVIDVATNATITANAASMTSTAGGNAWTIAASTFTTTPSGNGLSNGGWRQITFTAAVNSDARIRFYRSGNNYNIDDIAITPFASGTTPPALAAAANQSVDNDFNITFTDAGGWAAATTGIIVDGTTYLAASGAYTINGPGGTLVLSRVSIPELHTATSHTVVVKATGFTDASVTQTNIAGAANKLGMSVQPVGPASNGGTLATQPVVAIQDQYGNTTTSTATVTPAVGAGTWTIGGSNTAGIAAVAGLATFTNLTATSAAAEPGATIAFTSVPSYTGTSSSAFLAPGPIFDYRSNGTGGGNWNSAGTWEIFSGGNWIGAAAGPTSSSAGLVTIRNNDVVTVTASVSTDQTTIDLGGQVTINASQTLTVTGAGTQLNVNGTLKNSGTLTPTGTVAVNSGGFYENNIDNATTTLTVPTITWASGSTCKFSGTYSGSGDITMPSSILTANIWINANITNATNGRIILQSVGNSLQNITIEATGSGTVFAVASGNGGLVTVASFTQLGGTFLCNRNGGGTRTMTVTGNVDIQGGTLDIKQGGSNEIGALNVGGNLKVFSGGTLTKTGSGTANLTFTKVGTQILENAGTVSGVINTSVNGSSNISLNSDYTISGTLSLTGTITIGANTLTLGGAVTGAGTLTGSSGSNLTINGAAGTLNFAGGGQILKDLSLGTSATASLGTALAITGGASFGTVTVASGATLTGGNNLTLRSDAAGTARIGSSAGSITGDVTVERYIPSKRAWRLLTIPVTSNTKTVRDAWANHAPNGNSPSGEVAGSGTNITGTAYGSGAAATGAGFDWWASIANTASSIRRYIITGSSGDWPAYSDNNPINVPGTFLNAAEQGYMLFVRGDRTVTTGVGATTLRPVGTLKMGTQSYSIPAPGTAAYKVIGNPYAATISFESLMANGVNSTRARDNRFWIWDANNGSTGGYRLVNKLGAGNWERIPAPMLETTPSYAEYIRSSQAFMIEALTAGTNDFTIDENDKGEPAGTPPSVFDAINRGRFYANLNLDNGSGNLLLADGIGATFDAGGNNGLDGDDVGKIDNFNENVSLQRNSRRLTLEARPLITDNDTLFLQLNRLTPRNYAFQFKGVQMQAGIAAILQDAYLGKETAISTVGDIVTVNFSVTADAASSVANRFQIVFKPAPVLPLTLTSAKAYSLNTGVQVDWKTVNERGLRSYEVEKSIDGRSFAKATTIAATGATAYGWYDVAPVKGNNYYRIKGVGTNGDASYSQVLMVNLNSGKSAFSVYPNPVKGGIVGVQFSNMEKGKYSMVVYNSAGQKVISRDITHLGGSATEEINLGTMASGVYRISLISTNGNALNQTLVIQK